MICQEKNYFLYLIITIYYNIWQYLFKKPTGFGYLE
jgi:hypothetical protein